MSFRPSNRRGPPARRGGARHHHGHPGNAPIRPSSRPEGGHDPEVALPVALAKDVARARELTASRLAAWAREGASATTGHGRTLGGGEAPLQLDPWQAEVLEALLARSSVVVDAPTSAGKTRAVEAYFKAHLSDPLFRACYTTPVKSLANDKLREFRAMFGEQRVGIATGDLKENLAAPIVVATLESYRNSLLGVEPDLGRTLVVFDEYHYLQDESRGSAWEEAMILTPPSCQLLLLSASVANAEEFVDWIHSLGPEKGPRRPCVLVRTETRPVPLVPLVFYGGGWILADALPKAALERQDRQLAEVPLRQELIAERAVALLAMGLAPCILYCGKRLTTETLATLLCRHLEPLDERASEHIGQVLEQCHREFKALSFLTTRQRHMLQVYGVGYHHSGMAAPARMAVETLVKSGTLRFTTATMGLSLGINFAVRSALITDYQRPGEQGLTPYSPSEVLQMLGRAGRRGRDQVGFSLWPAPEAFQRLGDARRERVVSKLRKDPTTFLGLVGKGYSLREIEGFYARSFHRFQDLEADLRLLDKSRLAGQLGRPEAELPCSSPVAAFAQFSQGGGQGRAGGDTACGRCAQQTACHPLISQQSRGTMAALHLHLHGIGALTPEGRLTLFGDIARYFPQAGGLYLARLLAEGRFGADDLPRFAQLAGALTTARFKELGTAQAYRPPFDPERTLDELEKLYPSSLFPELYDTAANRRTSPGLREFNPNAGYLVREWLNGAPWGELIQTVTSEYFGTGDAMALLYRVGTYLQSIAQAPLPELAPTARLLRDVLLREPLSITLDI